MLTRRRLLAAGGAALAAGCGGEDDARRERRRRVAADVEIVRFLLEIERVAAAYWDAVAARRALHGSAAALAAAVARNDRTHAETLERFEWRLGGAATRSAPPAGAVRLAAGAAPADALRRGARLANLAAAAYTGQLNRIQDRNLLASVLAIHSVEGRHALALDHEAGGGAPFPDGAFAGPLTMDQARARLRELLP